MIEKKEKPESNHEKKRYQARRVGTLDIILAALLEGRLATLFLIGEVYLLISHVVKKKKEDVRFSILPITLANYLSLGIDKRIVIIVGRNVIDKRPVVLERKRDPRDRFHSSNDFSRTIRIRPLAPTQLLPPHFRVDSRPLFLSFGFSRSIPRRHLER